MKQFRTVLRMESYAVGEGRYDAPNESSESRAEREITFGFFFPNEWKSYDSGMQMRHKRI